MSEKWQFMPKSVACIYCGVPVDPSKGEGDHIVPAVLGEFREDMRLRRICPTCNNHIGKSEAQLVRCGPERLYRDLVGVQSRRTTRRGDSWGVGAEGAPPPAITVRPPGSEWPLLAELPKGSTAPVVVDQLIVLDNAGAVHHIPLFLGMSPGHVAERFYCLPVPSPRVAGINVSEADTERYLALIREALSVELTLKTTTEAGEHAADARILFTVNDHYYRALAKMAFHYFLTFSDWASGAESCFADLREFILNGGDTDRFFQGAALFIEEGLPECWRPEKTMHVFAALERQGKFTGYVRLFYGPLRPSIDHHITLGGTETCLILPTRLIAHAYVYDDPRPAKGKVGEVISRRVQRLA
jgi:hypothetical protein